MHGLSSTRQTVRRGSLQHPAHRDGGAVPNLREEHHAGLVLDRRQGGRHGGALASCLPPWPGTPPPTTPPPHVVVPHASSILNLQY